MRERLISSCRAFVEIVIWKLPKPLPDSRHAFKYRLAYIAIQRLCFASTTRLAKAITGI
jgi:hypothetical protein